MTRNLICKDLIIQENIRSEFYIYYVDKINFQNYKSSPPKYVYYLREQLQILDDYDLTIFLNWQKNNEEKSVYYYIVNLIKAGTIPKRYLPKKEIIFEGYSYCSRKFKTLEDVRNFLRKTKRSWLYNKIIESKIKVGRLVFKEAIISLLIQKKLDEDIINFFITLTKKTGRFTFDEYIDNWAKRLIKKFF